MPDDRRRRRRPTKPTQPLPNPGETINELDQRWRGERRRVEHEQAELVPAEVIEEDRREEWLALSCLYSSRKAEQECAS